MRTALCVEFPDKQGKNREFCVFERFGERLVPKKLSICAGLWANSLL